LENLRKLYGYPDMGRTGLGHSLLAWARCVVWCEATGATMLAPRWMRLRVGPYRRKERDKREYFRLFQSADMVDWKKRSVVLALSTKSKSHDGMFDVDIFDIRFLREKRQGPFPHVVVFDNAGADNELKHFRFIKGHSCLLRERFFAMVRPQFMPTSPPRGRIAIHVRLGDFAVASATAAVTTNNIRIPLAWYKAVLLRLRQDLGQETPATVFSDGADEELAELLAMPSVTRAPKQESVTDLLSISHASALIASGSGFSLWGAFFGQVPSINYPGRKRVGANADTTLDVESDGTSPLSEKFVATVADRLRVAA
jgi:hypothetical protein